MPIYRVLESGNILHDGKPYTAGDTLNCTEKQAKLLTVEMIDTETLAYEKMTVAQLTEEVLKADPEADLKGLKKADLIEIIKESKKGAKQ